MRTFALLSAVLVFACGDDDGGGGVDGAAEATVTIDTEGASLVAARPVDGTWTVLTPDGNGLATYRSARTFEVMAVCIEPTTLTANVSAFRAAPTDVTGDADQFAVDCFVLDVFPSIANGLDREVRLTLGPRAYQEATTIVTLAPGASGTISVDPGVHDVVVEDVLGGTAGVLRGATFSDGATVTVAGVALAPLTTRDFTAPTRPNARVTSVFESAAGSATLGDAGDTAFTVAPSVAQDGDRHLLIYEEVEDLVEVRGRRRVAYLDPASTAAVQLSPAPFVSDATLTGEPRLSATYQAEGVWPRRVLTGGGWRVQIYDGAGAEAGSVTAPDPTDIPGWDPAWNLTSVSSTDLQLTLVREDATGRDEIDWLITWP